MIKLFNYLAIFTIFSDAFTFRFIPCIETRIAYFILALILISLLPFLRKLYFNRTFCILFFAIIFFSLLNVYWENDSIFLLFKQAAGILVNAFFFYTLIKINEEKIKGLFSIYLNFAFYIAVIGLFQFLSYWLHFKYGYDFSYFLPRWRVILNFQESFIRVNSILTEPSGFCVVMLPAFFVSLVAFLRDNLKLLSRWKGLVIILAVILSTSTIGYLGIMLSAVLLIYNYRKVKLFVVSSLALFIAFFVIYNTIDDFKLRVDDSLNIITGKVEFGATSLSTVTFFSNAIVAYDSFKRNPFIGSGLGSHEVSYSRMADKLKIRDKEVGVNSKDANSLFLRLLSETGIFGLLIFLIFICRFHIARGADPIGYLWIINNSALIMFAARFLRVGHYFTDGFFFFVWIYYFSKVKLKELCINKG